MGTGPALPRANRKHTVQHSRSTSMHSRLLTLAGISALGASLVACAGDSTGPNGAAGSVPLSFSATGASTTASKTSLGTATLSNALAGSSSVDALVITKAQLVLARLELERAGS